MTEKTQLFQFAGERPAEKTEAEKKKKWYQDRPVAAGFLSLLVLGCLFLWADHDEGSLVYGSEKLFRHAVPGISVWNRYDGKRYFLDDLVRRQNIAGDRSAFYADFHCDCRSLRRSQRMCTGVAGRASDAADRDLLSVPNLLLVIFLLAAAGKSNVITISAVIGMTSWTSIAKVVRTEVRQIRNSEYVIASRCMGGSFFYILWHHLAPNFFRLLCLWWL